MATPLHYPDGEPCRVGDVVWLENGRTLGRVAACTQELRGWQGLSGQNWGPFTCPAEAAQRLTNTEFLAVELLFRLLARQLRQPLWDNAAWHCAAELEQLGGERVWLLALAPQAAPEQVQRFRFDRRALRFLRPEEPFSPQPPSEPAEGARSVTSRDGVTYREGDYLWEYGGPGVHISRLHTIIHPEDEDWQWYYELEEERTPRVLTSGLAGRSGTCIAPLSFVDDEWGGRLSDTERLAVELLVHQLKKNRLFRMRGWESCLNHVELVVLPDRPYDETSFWEYQYAQWTIGVSFCSARDSHIHAHRYFRFNRESGDFSLLPEAEGGIHDISGGGWQPSGWERLRIAFFDFLARWFPRL